MCDIKHNANIIWLNIVKRQRSVIALSLSHSSMKPSYCASKSIMLVVCIGFFAQLYLQPRTHTNTHHHPVPHNRTIWLKKSLPSTNTTGLEKRCYNIMMAETAMTKRAEFFYDVLFVVATLLICKEKKEQVPQHHINKIAFMRDIIRINGQNSYRHNSQKKNSKCVRTFLHLIC